MALLVLVPALSICTGAFCVTADGAVFHPYKIALFGYGLTVAIEVPLLLVLLAPVHKPREKLLAGFLLTAITYPFVSWIFPFYIQPSATRIAAQETFAASAECALFIWLFYATTKQTRYLRDCSAIVLANICSFLVGELLKSTGLIWPMLGWFGLA